MARKIRARPPSATSKSTPARLLLSESHSPREPFFFAASVFAFLIYVLILNYCHVRALDLWWHLETGELIWSNHAVPRSDPFSYSAPDAPWVAHEWLFGLVSYAAFRLGGIQAIILGKSLLLALIFGAVAWTARIRGATAAPIFLVLAMSYSVLYFRFLERPDLFSMILAVGFILIEEISRRRPLLLWVLPGLQWLWVNLHGGTAILGWALALSIFAGRFVEAMQADPESNRLQRTQALRRALLPTLAVVLVSFLNPFGWRTLIYGLVRAESPLDNKEFVSLYEVLGGVWDLPLVVFLVFAGSTLGFMVARRRSTRTHEWLLFPLLLILTVVFFRFRTYFIVLFAPTLAWHLSQKLRGRYLRPWVLASLSLLFLARDTSQQLGSYFHRLGSGVHDGIFPVRAVQFMEEQGITGTPFNSYGFGGYLIWRLWPAQRVFIDGREDIYLEAGVLREYVDCFKSGGNWAALNQKYQFDYAIVRYPEAPPATPQQSLDEFAFVRSEWALVYFDDVAVIYLRRNGKNASLIPGLELETVRPLQLSVYMDSILDDPERTRQFLKEIQTAFKWDPDSFRGHFLLGMFAVKRGPEHIGEALKEFLQTVRLNPDFAPAHVNLGSIYLHLGRIREAEEAFEKALSLEKNPLAEEQLRRLRSAP